MTIRHAHAPLDDPLGAFCRHTHVALRGAASGRLQGLTFGVKDVFHIADHPTGFGHPDWLRTHPPATVTATAVQRLLAAGAHMVGKTQTDELAYSLTGENIHYGTPVNPRDPQRIPEGSSNAPAAPPQRLLVATDAFAMVDQRVRETLHTAIARVSAVVGATREVTVSVEGLQQWLEVFRVIQAFEIWTNHAPWIQEVQPTFALRSANALPGRSLRIRGTQPPAS